MRATNRLLGLPVAVVVTALGAACKPSQPADTAQQPASASPSAGHGGGHGAAQQSRSALLGQMGAHHRTITTSSPEAQQFFDEGLTLLYGFNHEEAFRSFEHAARLDDKAPMPHWGMSLALGTNYNDTATPDRLGQAYEHLARARAREANGSDVERALISALGVRYVDTPNDGKQAEREAAYSTAMGEVSAKYGDDLDAATLYAESLMNLRPWKLYDANGKPAAGTEEIVETLESVLARNPVHPGANHYYIHAVEASRAPERAMASAKRLETLVPGAGHLVHMPAHIYIRTGDYLASAKSNAEAARVDEKYVQTTGAKGMYPLVYYGHNLQFESAALMFAGQYAGARAAAQKTVKLADPIAGEMVMVQPFVLQEGLVFVRFGRWDDALALAPPPSGRPVQEAYYQFVRGAALAGKGDVAGATKAAEALEAATKSIPADAIVSSSNSASAVVDVARLNLAARLADAGGTSAAIKAWTAAVDAEDRLGYAEPPDWLLPSREGLGAALLRAGKAAEAEKVFRADLAVYRNNPRSLFGLWKSLDRQGKTAAADTARQDFDNAWRGADTTLDEAAMKVASR
jgi:tetratricopeptide (TPR) repeat protein